MSASNPHPTDIEVTKPRWTLGRALRFLLGPMILAILFWTTDIEALKGAFGRTKLHYVAWAYLAILPTIPIRTLRWRILLGPEFRPKRFSELLEVYTYAIFVGVVTPGRLGEFVKTVHVARWGAPTSVAFVKVLFDRLFDVALLCSTAFAGFWIISFEGFDARTLAAGGAATLLVGVGALLFSMRDMKRRGPMSRAVARVTPQRLRRPLQQLRDELVHSSWWARLRVHGSAALLTVAAWGFNYLANYLLACALGLELSYLQVAAISAISSLISLVPITLLGAGTRDAALVVLLGVLGGTRAEALAFSTLLLTLILWLAVICAPSAWSSARRRAAEAHPAP
ncbi:MAG: lysylphosphatidylglycerol synthase transmembrane domain-containing protein [Nannocystaceae bacterium]